MRWCEWPSCLTAEGQRRLAVDCAFEDRYDEPYPLYQPDQRAVCGCAEKPLDDSADEPPW